MGDEQKRTILIETILMAADELRLMAIAAKRSGELTPEESLEEALIENDEHQLLTLMHMPTHPTQH